MDRQSIDDLKARVGILDYLRQLDWKPCRYTAGGQVAGLCPLHAESHPSFWIHTRKNVFYCHGCGRGGDLIRFLELYHGLTFPQALTQLRRWAGPPQLLSEVAAFYRMQLHRAPEAIAYLADRGIRDANILESLAVGYAPGACLRRHLLQSGYTESDLRQAGLITVKGWDTFYRRVVFPLEHNFYGRSIGAAPPHRFLPGGKGGLYGYQHWYRADAVILVEGMFDLAALWQAGFWNTTCAWGVNLSHRQFQQLVSGPHTVWIAFDGDPAGQRAARELAKRLRNAGLHALPVILPAGHDPASYFAAGASAADFHRLLEEVQP